MGTLIGVASAPVTQSAQPKMARPKDYNFDEPSVLENIEPPQAGPGLGVAAHEGRDPRGRPYEQPQPM
jgi:hypothetical protein